jgi:hypothetical protein
MADSEDNIQVSKKQRLHTGNNMSDMGDVEGDSNAMEMGDHDQAISNLTLELDKMQIIEAKVDTAWGEIEALQQGFATMIEQNNTKELQYDLLTQATIKKTKTLPL